MSPVPARSVHLRQRTVVAHETNFGSSRDVPNRLSSGSDHVASGQKYFRRTVVLLVSRRSRCYPASPLGQAVKNEGRRTMRALAIGFLLLAAEPSLGAETYVGSDADAQRTILGFKVPDAAIRKVLPQGWEPDVATSGPDQNINLRLTFIDRLTAQNAEGRTLDPLRLLTVTIPAKKTGSETRGSMAFRIYSASASGVPGVYGAAVQA